MNGPLTIGYMAAAADIERRKQTQRDRQQRAVLAGNRSDSGANGFALARLGAWLRDTSAFADKRDAVNCPAMAC